jgi:hypothetical protein
MANSLIFPSLHLRYCHSPRNWCKDCLESFPKKQSDALLAVEMAAHEKSCPGIPTQENINNRSLHLILPHDVWTEFQGGDWERLDIPSEEPRVNRSYRQISEFISGLSLLSLLHAPSQDTRVVLPSCHQIIQGPNYQWRGVRPRRLRRARPKRIPDDKSARELLLELHS